MAAFAGVAAWSAWRESRAAGPLADSAAETAALSARIERLEAELAAAQRPTLAAAPRPAAGTAKTGTGADETEASGAGTPAQGTPGAPVVLGDKDVQAALRELLAARNENGRLQFGPGLVPPGEPATPATPPLPPDEIRARLETASEDDRARLLAELERARDPSYLPLLTDTVMSTRTPLNVHRLIDRIAELKDRRWSAKQATGAPDTPIGGDLGTAWAPKQPEMGEVTLDLTYRDTVRVDGVRIHETWSAGAVARIQAKAPDGSWDTIWEGTAPRDLAPLWFEPALRHTSYTTNAIRIVLDTNRVAGWNEIDAVELEGDGQRQWATGATASSSYADR